jgi:Fic family protein
LRVLHALLAHQKCLKKEPLISRRNRTQKRTNKRTNFNYNFPYRHDIIRIMSDSEADKLPDKQAVEDRGETIGAMEPMLISESSRHYGALVDLTVELTARSTQLKSALPPGVVEALARLVRAMNCYYSNLIEGHDTHPIDIERAMQNDYSDDPKKRDLQKEARAHIEVQTWIDEGGLKGIDSPSGRVLEIHRRFGELLPEDLLKVENPDTGEVVALVSGELRHRDVRVGRHVAVSPGALPRFMARFDQAYGRLGRANAIVAAATAHHRLLWMHPFLDGNGRVARLISYAMLREALDTGGIWSIARGLARNETDYKQHLMACDGPRRNDLDGRGNLSEEALASFVGFFLRTCIDQVEFMQGLVQPDKLRERILGWAKSQRNLPGRSEALLEAVLYRGEVPRSDVAEILQTVDRNARRTTAALIERGVLVSESSRAPLRLAFPATLAHEWMPGLFPEKPKE